MRAGRCGHSAGARPGRNQRGGDATPVRRRAVALETGTHSAWISELLESLGHEVIVANPRKVRSISVSDSKTDRFDAEQLAWLARVDRRLLSPVAHRDRATRADLTLVRSRGALVRARTLLVNHVRGSLKSFGVRVRACSTAVFPRRAAWKIPCELRAALIPLLRGIAGRSDPRIGQGSAASSDFARGRLCANLDGFSLHAAVRVDGCNTERLERLCRLCGSPHKRHHADRRVMRTSGTIS